MKTVNELTSVLSTKANKTTGERWINIWKSDSRSDTYFVINKWVTINKKQQHLFKPIRIPFTNANKEQQLQKAIKIRNELIELYGLDAFFTSKNHIPFTEDHPITGVLYNPITKQWVVNYRKIIDNEFISTILFFSCNNDTKEQVKRQAIAFREQNIKEWLAKIIINP